MTSELFHLIATGRAVHPTVPSFAKKFGHPDVPKEAVKAA
jgi:hypothetical protein